jgi:hypothetical protein
MTTYNVGPVLPHVQVAANVMGTRFGIITIGGYRAYEDGGYHPRGRALDFMCTTAQGNELAPWAWANRDGFGVIEVIWRQHIITVARASEGWRPMGDRGSPTQNHMDHVHISFNQGGGSGGTDVPPGAVPTWGTGGTITSGVLQAAPVQTATGESAADAAVRFVPGR